MAAAAKCLFGPGCALSLEQAGLLLRAGLVLLQEWREHPSVRQPVTKTHIHITPAAQGAFPCSREKQGHCCPLQAAGDTAAVLACLPFQSGAEAQEGPCHPV